MSAAPTSRGSDASPLALYVHVPFCLSVCPYCDFVVFGGAAARGPRSRIEPMVAALVAEMELRAPAPARRSPLRSVYFGGGTPSLLTPAQVGRLLAAADAAFGLAAGAEVTLEVNPGPADRGDLAGSRAAGVNRLSVGAQSLDTAELRRIGRRHAPAHVGETVHLARRAGFDNVSLDLLYDLPGQTLASWRSTLVAALALEPDHVSAYALTLDDPDAEGLTGMSGDHLPLRPGARRWRERARSEQDVDRAAEMYATADEAFAAAGLSWYELSNWARPGRESRHNRFYWTGAAYEGVGPGAHAFDGKLTRRWNAARLEGYLGALTEGRQPPATAETTDPATALADAAILRLRTADGLPAAWASTAALRSGLDWGLANDLLEWSHDGRLRFTFRGRLLANEQFVRLLPTASAHRTAAA